MANIVHTSLLLLRLKLPDALSWLQVRDTEHFATVGPDNNFQLGCQTFWPAIFNQ